MLTDRSDLIIQYFNYLIKEFDFNIEKKEFDPNMMGNAYVIFRSARVEIEIVIDRDQVLISLGDRKKSREKWFNYSDVLKLFAPSEVAYSDLEDLFNEKRANHISNADTWDEVIEVQLDRLAVMLRRYCEPILKGDFSMKKDIKQIEEKRVSEMLKRFNNTSVK
jgi:hypothetical protein